MYMPHQNLVILLAEFTVIVFNGHTIYVVALLCDPFAWDSPRLPKLGRSRTVTHSGAPRISDSKRAGSMRRLKNG
jgi:hypothetical protein